MDGLKTIRTFLIHQNELVMKPSLLLAAATLVLFLYSCGDNERKGNDKPSSATTTQAEEKNNIPSIDIAGLKNEAAVLDAMQKVADARIADEKLKKEDPKYTGNYLELTKLYTAVLNASTEFSKTITDPAKRIEFMNKVSAIQDKMYAN